MKAMRVLVTRPEPDAARTAARLKELGHEAVIEPLLAIEPVAIETIPPGPFAVLAATSANAMRVAGGMAALDFLRALPLHAVGSHSAIAAREAGFKIVIDADGDVAALAHNLSRHVKPPARVLHLAGEERAQELGPLLAAHGIEVEVLALYRMRSADRLGAAAALIVAGQVDAVLHFSPRSAATFVALVERQGLADAARALRHLCLSRAVAAPLAAIGAKTEVAAAPNEAALFALLNS